jgi:hypothetical protein
MADLLSEAQVVMDSSQTRPIKIRGSFALPKARTVHEGVARFLADNAETLAVPFGTAELKLVKQDEVAGREVLRYDHAIDGIRVFGAQTIATVDPAENVLRHLDLYSGPTRIVRAPANARAMKPAAALKAAEQAIGAHTLRMEAPPPEPVWYPTQAGVVRALVFLIPTREPAHDWQIIVEAATGRILDQRDLLKHMPDGTGLVFDPNPVVTANNSSFRDPAATMGACGFAGTSLATLNAQRVSRTLRDLTMSGSNFTLSGPWCRIHNFGAPASVIPTETSGNFNYACNDERFNAVMVYFHIDGFQRYLQSIGITNAHASPIRCDPLDNATGGAFYSPADLGLHFGNSGNCQPDRATDADCMIHEYQHAIQDNMVPGWASSNNPVTGRDEAGAMGEGAGDFVACAYYADRGNAFQREVFEDWVFAPGGLRRVDGTKTYPASWVSQVHSDGEIWAAALWNIYRAIGGDAGGTGAAAAHENARQAMFRSLFGSYPLLATNASMPDGAEALMRTNAALPAYRGAHLREMLQSFHDRGILAVNPAADVYIRDDSADPGTTAYHASVFWDSPDVWVRNSDDNGTTHLAPIAGHDNWFYARVRNRGTAPARAFVVTFNVKLWLGTEFAFPADFVPYFSAAPGFSLAPGADLVVKAKWPAALVPPSGSHGCLLVSVFSPLEPIPAGANVWNHPNLAQKNLEVVTGDAGDTVAMKFRFGNSKAAKAQLATLELRNPSSFKLSVTGNPVVLGEIVRGGTAPVQPAAPVKPVPPPIHFIDPARIAVAHGDAPLTVHLAAGSAISLGSEAAPAAAHSATAAAAPRTILEPVRAPGGQVTGIGLGAQTLPRLDVALGARTDTEFTVKAVIPKSAKRGGVHIVDAVQRDQSGIVVGGVRLAIHIR